eukprot:TRINITY_DN2572_c0_g1_i1.p2 TRINITY_DN2572_c0_g1~~TRINITY_DN2572_c0_g1_i1.p2  ORF type:complete len:163 (+),score=27.46 TRINITY_DN2572_c0_g1_i1:129-617(+)
MVSSVCSNYQLAAVLEWAVVFIVVYGLVRYLLALLSYAVNTPPGGAARAAVRAPSVHPAGAAAPPVLQLQQSAWGWALYALGLAVAAGVLLHCFGTLGLFAQLVVGIIAVFAIWITVVFKGCRAVCGFLCQHAECCTAALLGLLVATACVSAMRKWNLDTFC